MKFNFKKFSKKNQVLLLVLFVFFTSTTLMGSFARSIGKPTVIVFYTEWNSKSREALPAVEQVTSSYNNTVDLQELNMDLNTTPDRARALGTSIPSTVPYVVVLNKNGNTVFQQAYNKQTSQQLSEILNSVVKKS